MVYCCLHNLFVFSGSPDHSAEGNLRMASDERKTALFKTVPVPKALLTMAIPTILSQLITLIYNVADTWFIISYLVYARVIRQIRQTAQREGQQISV